MILMWAISTVDIARRATRRGKVVEGLFSDSNLNNMHTYVVNRHALMFYGLESKDVLGKTPLIRNDNPSQEGTFQATVDQLAQITLLVDPSASFKGSGASLVPNNKKSVQVNPAAQAPTGSIPNLLPEAYGNSILSTRSIR